MKNVLTIAFAAALLTLGCSAQAQIVLGDSYTSYLTDPANVNDTVQVIYDVTESASIYTYTYNFTYGQGTGVGFVAGSEELAEFDIDASYVIPGSLTGDAFGFSGIAPGYVYWKYDSVASDTVSYQSNIGPGYGGADAFDYNDPSGELTSGNVGGSAVAVPTPASGIVPVPEASTVMAGAMMLLPLGMGVVRVLRKQRTA